MPGHLTAAAPNEVWAIDFVSDRTADGRPLKILTVTDEHTREALATPVARRMGADDTVSVLERIVERRGRAPKLIRCDNGPEFISQSLRDWCRFNNAGTGYIEPGAPWQNPFVESFNGHLRRELLEMESFNSLFEAQLLLEDWRLEYNHYRPHQSLNYQTPRLRNAATCLASIVCAEEASHRVDRRDTGDRARARTDELALLGRTLFAFALTPRMP